MESIPLSYISQYGYCPRRAGLMLLEQAWAENEYTASGRVQHGRVHEARVERRGDMLMLLDYPVASEALGLSGKCDCVEVTPDQGGVFLPWDKGQYMLYPIEYKHGVVREEHEYYLQLCAQAMCLEEMLGGRIERGALFFADAHRRAEVVLDETLRSQVREAVLALQALLANQRMPGAVYSPKCKKCSLLELCSPKLPASGKAYCAALVREMEEKE